MRLVYFEGGRCIFCGAYDEMLLSLCGWPGMLCENCALEMVDDDTEDDDVPPELHAPGADAPRA